MELKTIFVKPCISRVLERQNAYPWLKNIPEKNFVISCCISTYSILNIIKTLLERRELPFDVYWVSLIFRFSQAPIEMQFSKICSRIGWNSPTVLQLQLKYALKPLFKNNIESPNAANCLPVSEQKCSATGSGKLNTAVCGQLV